MKNINKYSDKDWEQLASLFSGEEIEKFDHLNRFTAEDQLATEKKWKELGDMNNKKEINTDMAWNKVFSRIEENGMLTKTVSFESRNRNRTLLKIAAIALVILGFGTIVLYLNNKGDFNKTTVVATNSDQKNFKVLLTDGSTVYLNRSSRLSYKTSHGKPVRHVNLQGEAFFEITPDASDPFTIDAGKANVKVLGTSFNVITNNRNNSVEVFVETGKVMLSDTSGSQNLVLEPGFIGTIDTYQAQKTANIDSNYMSWKTDLLVYEAGKLDVVLHDLKKVYNIDVSVDNPTILNNTITTVFDKDPQDTIMSVICTTFNLSYKKEGSVYHLTKR